MIKLLATLSLLWAAPQLAEKPRHYYGQSPFRQLEGQALKDELFHILSSHHISQANDSDQIIESCNLQEDDCYVHRKLGYNKARKYLFGYLDLEEGPDGYELTSIYCRKRFTNEDFPSHKNLGPMKIPKNTIVNTEHSWPQSKFSHHFSKKLQKGDLQALFPTVSKVNSQRGNYPYGQVEEPTAEVCGQATLGKDDNSNRMAFEPSDKSKGNVARAVFYFSIRYKMKIDENQERYLRQWHEADPVDAREQLRHNEIYSIQYNRNPFVDYPHLVQKIKDF